MSHHEKFERESQDARRRDQQRAVHPNEKSTHGKIKKNRTGNPAHHSEKK